MTTEPQTAKQATAPMAALLAGRYAFLAWRTTSNVAFRALILVALLADIVVLGVAVVIGLLILNRPIVA